MNAREYRQLHGRQKGQCTWCGKPVPKGNRTWCSYECVKEWQLRYDWDCVRSLVRKRDRGVCAQCGFDDEARKRLFWRLTDAEQRYLRRFYVRQGFPLNWQRDWWEAHHVVPRRDGGSNELDNLITLCVPCHRATFARVVVGQLQE